ncbi:hypothetical protein PR048_032766 [Dryococelus australis]|uniref:Mutator-like transposase domain-containing protein n=1 Tax=Dryococelus australis TaxID=614101 RepID=A0ABQ9G355_9NEOP|nr:hypothetical protein PR048_032766 [Dryococelus australis]
MEINDAWVNSMLLTGQGFSQLRDTTASLEMPRMSKETYQNSHKNLSAVIKEVSWQKNAITSKREIDVDGIRVLTVVTDAAWSRSYVINYNVLSGVACIIGATTKKVSFTSTRNSYCCICDRASSKGESKNNHVCYKNWNKSSTAMQADILVEGFRNSIDMHNLKNNKLIEFCLAASAAVASPTAGALDADTYKNTIQGNSWEDSDMAFNHPAQSHEPGGELFLQLGGRLKFGRITDIKELSTPVMATFRTLASDYLGWEDCFHPVEQIKGGEFS